MTIKIKLVSLALLVLLMTACASTTEKTVSQSKPIKAEKVATVNKIEKVSLDTNGSFRILINIPFSENGNIPDNVRQECTMLGQQLSKSVVKYAPKHGISVEQTRGPLGAKGKVVELKIESVFSAGNAFMGHKKSAMVSAKLMMDGKEVAQTTKTRNSGGGFLGGFKGSCSVLAHTVNTLGSDVGRWLSKQ